MTVFDSLSCKTKYYWAFKERLICILWIISRLVSHPSQPRLIKGSHRARLCWCRVSTGGEDLLSLRRLGFFNFDMIDCYQLNIAYGQSSAKLPVIWSLGSFGSFRTFGSFRSFGSFGSFGTFGIFGTFRSFACHLISILVSKLLLTNEWKNKYASQTNIQY